MTGFIRSLAPWWWKPVPCEIIDIKVADHAESEIPFVVSVRYRFEWQGSVHESNRVGIEGWKDAATPLALVKTLTAAPRSHCYLPDGVPGHAVLLRTPPAWGNMSFIGFGFCVGWILIQAHLSRNRPGVEVSRRIMPAVAVFFGAIGVVLIMALSWPVWVESIQVRSWKETTATVAWSTVRTTRGAKSTSYHADICYEYQAAGRIWRNNQIRPGHADGFTEGAARKLVADHPPGSRTRCFVNPSRPEQGVLKQSPGWAVLLTLFPLPFLAIGLFCGWAAIRSLATEKIRRSPRDLTSI